MIDTDYDNYALVYGCDRLWTSTLGILAFEKVTFLSKEKYTQFPYVLKAQQKLKEIGYNYFDLVKPGLECGIDASPAADELMLNIFSR